MLVDTSAKELMLINPVRVSAADFEQAVDNLTIGESCCSRFQNAALLTDLVQQHRNNWQSTGHINYRLSSHPSSDTPINMESQA